MKFYKISVAALSALMLAACSDDDNLNTSDVTVNMKDATMLMAEDFSSTYYHIPVVLDGVPNGPVKVTIDVAEETTEPAMEDIHYVITSKTITIPKGQTEGYFEIIPTGDNEVNEDRVFSASIVSAQGANVGPNATCTITILDDDHYLVDAYTYVQGTYTFRATNPSNGAAVSQTWIISGVNEGEEGYLKELTVAGLQGYAWAGLKASLSFDAVEKTASLTFQYGQTIAEQVGFDGIGNMDVKLGSVSGNSYTSSGAVSATASQDYSEILFAPSALFAGGLYEPGGGFAGYVWFQWTNMSLTKIQ